MRIRVEILGTNPHGPEGTYVYDTGELSSEPVAPILDAINHFVLRSLAELRVLDVRVPGSES
jgi:hypothetical protein